MESLRYEEERRGETPGFGFHTGSVTWLIHVDTAPFFFESHVS
jgi:hypothetical protein